MTPYLTPKLRYVAKAAWGHRVRCPRGCIFAVAGDTENHVPAGETATAGIAIWASVSDEVDRAIREQITSGVFPTRLAPDDWASGDKIWLLDLIAPNRQLATAVLANFRQIAGEKPVSIHPIVARSVDRQVLEKMRVKG